MKISKEAKDYVEAQFSIYLEGAQGILELKLKNTSDTAVFKNEALERDIRDRVDYIEGLISKKTTLYILAYRREGQIIDRGERDEMMQEFEMLVERHIGLIGAEFTNVFPDLSPDRAKAYEEKQIRGYRGALNIARRELDLAMTEMQVKEKERIRKVLLIAIYRKSNSSEQEEVSTLDLAPRRRYNRTRSIRRPKHFNDPAID